MAIECAGRWDCWWVKEALARLESLKNVKCLRPIRPSAQQPELGGSARRESQSGTGGNDDEYEVFEEMKLRDRTSVEIDVADSTFRCWFHDTYHDQILHLARVFWMCYHIACPGGRRCSGDDVTWGDGSADSLGAASHWVFEKLMLFSSEDYLGLRPHPTIGKVAAKAAKELGMGPRGSALICGHSDYRRLESCLAELQKKEVIVGH